jgi:catechol 2,3-dioxygenase-like lactoylglutathione lyase family enzyme
MLKHPRYVIAVPDLARSAAYYRDVLGFQVREIGDPGWRFYQRDDCLILAGECPDAIPPADLGDHSYFAYVLVEQIDAFFAEVSSRGAQFIKPLRNESWGMREFGIRTIDGHRMMFGTPLRPANSPSPDVDALITLIRDRRHDEALALVNASPALANAHSEKGGQLHGASPLHWAAHRNAVTLCRRLIELGANVNDSASDWWLTPLAWASDAGSAEAVELLLKSGADVNQDAVVGTTALHAVAMGGSSRGSADPDAYRRTAEILIAHGADFNRRATGDRRQTPLDDALANGNDSVAAVLRQHGAYASRHRV